MNSEQIAICVVYILAAIWVIAFAWCLIRYVVDEWLVGKFIRESESEMDALAHSAIRPPRPIPPPPPMKANSPYSPLPDPHDLRDLKVGATPSWDSIVPLGTVTTEMKVTGGTVDYRSAQDRVIAAITQPPEEVRGDDPSRAPRPIPVSPHPFVRPGKAKAWWKQRFRNEGLL